MPRDKIKQHEAQRRWFRELSQDKRKERNQKLMERRRALNEWYIEHKKTLKCEICGLDGKKYWPCLQFHHPNPSPGGNRNQRISVMRNDLRGKDDLIEEMKKCCVLCANCHAMEHARTGFNNH